MSGYCGTTTYTYDLKNRPVKVAESDGKYIEYEYDGRGSRTKMADHFGGVTTYEYYDRNLLWKITCNSHDTVYQYDADGQVTRINYPNDTYSVYEYSARHWVEKITHRKDSGDVLIAEFDYEYNQNSLGKNGTRTAVTETQRIQESPEAYYQARIEYSYDNLYHLTQDHRFVPQGQSWEAGATYDISYSYDALANRTSKTVGQSTTSYTYNSLNQLTAKSGAESGSYSYDDRGNMTSATESGTTRAYGWDCRNKLMCIVEGGVAIARYKYDGRGLRCQKTEGGHTVKFYYDGQTVSEEAESGNMTAFYAGPEKYIDEQWRVFHEDGLGSVRNVTSDAGDVTHLYVSDAYGVPQIHEPDDPEYLRNPYGYVGDDGYYYSKTTGLYLLQARYYDAPNGRFVSADPIGYVGGLNLCAYVDGRPTAAVDPSGLEWYERSGRRTPRDCAAELRECKRRWRERCMSNRQGSDEFTDIHDKYCRGFSPGGKDSDANGMKCLLLWWDIMKGIGGWIDCEYDYLACLDSQSPHPSPPSPPSYMVPGPKYYIK